MVTPYVLKVLFCCICHEIFPPCKATQWRMDDYVLPEDAETEGSLCLQLVSNQLHKIQSSLFIM